MTVHSNPLFNSLQGGELDDLYRNSTQKKYRKNTIILNEGDVSNSFYVIDSGRVKVYLCDGQGKEIVLNILEQGEYFGEVSLLDGEVRSASVITLEPSQFTIIPKQDFNNFLLKHPELFMQLMQGLSKKLRKSTLQIGSLALLDVYGRVANALIQLATKQEDGRYVVDQKMTHQNIANLVGSSREMVSRILRDLVADGQIKIDSKKRIILDKK